MGVLGKKRVTIHHNLGKREGWFTTTESGLDSSSTDIVASSEIARLSFLPSSYSCFFYLEEGDLKYLISFRKFSRLMACLLLES